MSDFPKGLPAEVAGRLDLPKLTTQAFDRRHGLIVVEKRIGRIKEIREVGNDIVDVIGYATVYDSPYDVAGGPPLGFRETIARGSAKKSIRDRDDVRFLINHDGVPLARTGSETMTLRSDDLGLLVTAGLDLRSVTARDAVIAMERGDLTEMSFAFQAIRQEWNDDYTERVIREVKLFDVSLVTYPANPATSATLDGERAESVPEPRGMSLSLARAEADALILSR